MTTLQKIQNFFLENPKNLGAVRYDADEIIKTMSNNTNIPPKTKLSCSEFEKIVGNVIYSNGNHNK